MDAEIVDHYSVLGLPAGLAGAKATEADIRKAYREKALKCHPDKRPDDPNATEEFLKIQTAYDLLSNPSARSAFDDLLRLRHERIARQEARNVEVSAKRRKMMDELNEREKLFEMDRKKQEQEDRASQRLKEEIAKIRAKYAQKKAGAFNRGVKEQESGNAKEDVKASGAQLEKEKMLKVSWDSVGGDYTSERLRQIFQAFGTVEDVVVRRNQSKKKGSAIIVMGSKAEMAEASRNVCGDLSNPLLVRPYLDSTLNPSIYSTEARQEEAESDKELHKVVGAGYQAFEDQVLGRMKKAAEKARAAKQTKN